ncbi:MAG: phosphatidylserine/phosphatidylglycerophosphate/cardiolipin synthase family protein [Gammaproteobacteria bacterium]
MGKTKKRKFLYPLRKHNTFRLHVDSAQYYPRLLESIKQAKNFIVIEQYLVESGHHTSKLIKALLGAANREVAVLLLFDDFGATGLNEHDRQLLQQKNIQLVFYNPIRYRRWRSNLKRDHRKLVIIDNLFGMTGGAGFTDDFDNENNTNPWHDIMIEVSGPVLNDWLASFISIWQQYNDIPQQVTNSPSAKSAGEMSGRLVVTQPPMHHGISRSVINHIQRSNQHVWLATPYFVISRKLRRTLIRAAKRGVDTRLLLPSDNSDHPWVTHAFHNYYDKLLKHGVRIFEYQVRFIHAKIIYCDQWTTIGSSNLDRWNERWNLDANQEIENAEFCRVVKHFFDDDFSQSHEITLTAWRQRSWLKRLREIFSRQLVLILEMIGRSRRY